MTRSNIAYRYEHPTAVVDRGKTRIWYPDFYPPGYGLIIEYFGVNGQKSYDNQVRHKMEVYHQNGLDGLFLTEASFRGDWPVGLLAKSKVFSKTGSIAFMTGMMGNNTGRCRTARLLIVILFLKYVQFTRGNLDEGTMDFMGL